MVITFARISTDAGIILSIKKSLRSFVLGILTFARAKAMRISFRVFEELVSFGLLMPHSALQIPDSEF